MLLNSALEVTNLIHIIDSGMGSGKTSAMINQMNGHPGVRFLFISQLLSEVDRVDRECPAFRKTDIGWLNGYGLSVTKSDALKKYLEAGVSIVSTHALFSMLDNDTLKMFHDKEQVLVCDETIQTIKRLDEKSIDIAFLLRTNALRVNEDHSVEWTDLNYLNDKENGKYKELAIECTEGGVSVEKDGKSYALMKYLNPKYFTSFKDVFILTYQFKRSVMDGYFNINKIEYDMWCAQKNEKGQFISEGEQPFKMRNKINLICNDKINDIGEDYYSLSKNWYLNAVEDDFHQLKNNLRTFYRNRCPYSSAANDLYTVFKGFETRVSSGGYSAKRCFLPFNTRATNQFADRNNIAFMINRFMSPVENRFFKRFNVEVSEDNLALNDMIQFVWRSAVRNGKPINLYIPSKRMRDLFIQWFDSVNETPIDTCGEIKKYYYQGV